MATPRDLNAAFARGFRNQAAPMAAFTAGFDKVVDPVLKREEREREIARRQKLQEEAEAKQEKKRLDVLAANSIGRVGANYNPEKVPNAMRPSLENLLFTTKQNAGNIALQADAARQQFGINSSEYIDLQTQLSSQQNVFQAANQIAIDQQELTNEYVKTRQNVSNGVAISKPGLLNKMQYVLDPNLRNYDMDWTNASDPTYITPEGPIKHSELDDYYSKDSIFGGEFLKDATSIYNRAAAGKPMSAPERDAYRASIISSLEAGGEARMQSVLHDNLFESFSLSEGIEAADYDQGIYDPQLREDIADSMLSHYDKMSSTGTGKYNEKSNPNTFKPEVIAEAKNILGLFRNPTEGSLVKGMVGNSNIVYINENWYPATESGYRVTGAAPISGPDPAAALNRLQIPITLYNQIKDQ
jgi:hypothetical protein